MKTAYLIDVENVGSRWLDLIDTSRGNLICLFRSDTTPDAPSSFVTSCVADVKIFEKNGAGKNNMDILLGCFCGILLEQNQYDRITIVSADQGFASLIAFLERQYSTPINLVSFPLPGNKTKTSKNTATTAKKKPKKSAQKPLKRKKKLTYDERLATFISNVSKNNNLKISEEKQEEILRIFNTAKTRSRAKKKRYLYENLCALLGANNGRIIYLALKQKVTA